MNELIFYDLKPSNRLTQCMSQQIARELGRQIVTGRILSNQVLESESSLAKRFGVCRTVAREAINTLVSKGLIEARRKTGIRVRPLNEWVLLDDDVLAWFVNNQPNIEFVKKMFEFRLSFESKAAFLAAQKGSVRHFEKIETYLVQLKSPSLSVQKKQMAEALLHKEILLASHNELLLGMDGIVYCSILAGNQLLAYTCQDKQQLVHIYEELIQSLHSRDAINAEQFCEKLLICKLQWMSDYLPCGLHNVVGF